MFSYNFHRNKEDYRIKNLSGKNRLKNRNGRCLREKNYYFSLEKIRKAVRDISYRVIGIRKDDH